MYTYTACQSGLTTANYAMLIVVHADGLCGLVVRVPVYRTELYCVSCEVRTELIFVM
jgi:hypothetical protein